YFSTTRSVPLVLDDLTRRIETAVQEARKSEKWRSVYMKERALFQELKEEGREEGRAEERKNTEQERIRAACFLYYLV
ncbi:MAG: hypothetical protein J6M27_04745, partial [Lachnospiraceae bacterium]|nr:hypothetical protein [Lachnospiraceae bacterium]